MAGVVVLDAGALIALYDSDDAHHPWTLELFSSTLDKDWLIPALTMAEVMVHPARAGRLDEFERSIRGLRISVVGLDQEDARAVAELRASSGLKMPDVVVLHTVLALSAELATTDSGLTREAIIRGVKTRTPSVD